MAHKTLARLGTLFPRSSTLCYSVTLYVDVDVIVDIDDIDDTDVQGGLISLEDANVKILIFLWWKLN